MNMQSRKVIHVDMDCFFAAVEIRDNPSLKDSPIAVGGANKRGVLCTCNYDARKYGLHSAMSTTRALQLCPELVVLAPRMDVYSQVAHEIRDIFYQFTDLVEPLSLDEAFLDVSNCEQFYGSATLIAQEIRRKIYNIHELTASAGIAPNKFLAKIASDWNKPNGQFVITPDQVDEFIKTLPVTKIFGVGKVTAAKLAKLNVQTCQDLQQLSSQLLQQKFGIFGTRLYNLCRGIDEREVEPHRIRKSLSVEKTFFNDLNSLEECINRLPKIYEELILRLNKSNKPIKKQFIKIKFNDFKQTTVEQLATIPSLEKFIALCEIGFNRQSKPVRLLGLGVRFNDNIIDNRQGDLFELSPQ